MYTLMEKRLDILHVQYVYAFCSPTFSLAKSQIIRRRFGERCALSFVLLRQPEEKQGMCVLGDSDVSV